MDNRLDTKERILDAAERLFAEQGFAATSLRAITSGAEANLAAVNYHFGSKEALIAAVFSRRLDPINQERLAWLDRLEQSATVEVEQILEAFLDPPLRVSQDPHKGEALLHVAQMIGHATSHPDPSLRDLLLSQFDDVVNRFTAALGRCLPQLEPAELLWRFLFMIGSMAHTMAMSNDIKQLSKGVCDPQQVDGLVASMVAFNAAGFRAPLRTPQPNGRG